MRTHFFVLVLFGLLLAGPSMVEAGQTAPAAPTRPANEDCLACHDDPAAARASGTSVAVDVRKFAASKHAAIACVDCHADLATLTEYPHAEKLKKATCATCHVEIGASYTDSIHGRARERAGLNVAPGCASCHGAHDIMAKTDPASRVAHANVPGTCGTCHDGIKAQYDIGAHAAALNKGDARAPSCATCHTAHAIARVDTEAGRRSVTSQCGTCHTSVVESYGRTFHGKVTALGSGSVAACSDCHSPHGVLPASNAASTVARQNLPVTCGKCHQGASASFVEYDPHPNPDDYHRSAALWWANRFYWILIPGCFGFFGLHSLLWFWRARREARTDAEPR